MSSLVSSSCSSRCSSKFDFLFSLSPQSLILSSYHHTRQRTLTRMCVYLKFVCMFHLTVGKLAGFFYPHLFLPSLPSFATYVINCLGGRRKQEQQKIWCYRCVLERDGWTGDADGECPLLCCVLFDLESLSSPKKFFLFSCIFFSSFYLLSRMARGCLFPPCQIASCLCVTMCPLSCMCTFRSSFLWVKLVSFSVSEAHLFFCESLRSLSFLDFFYFSFLPRITSTQGTDTSMRVWWTHRRLYLWKWSETL